MESPSPIEIISIDVPDTVLRKNVQNATNAACIATTRGHSGFEEAREKFINALVAENGNTKHLAAPKAAYPGLAKQIIATETGESQLLEEVGSADDEKKLGMVVEVEVEQAPLVSGAPATSSNLEDDAKDSDKDETVKDVATVGAASKLDENRVETLLKEEASNTRFANSSRDVENKSPVSSSSLSTTSAIDNSGRHECALSDFSVDKEDYRLTRYGQDADVQEEDIPCSTNDSDTKDLPSYSEEFSREQPSFYVPKEDDVTEDQKVPDNVIIDQENSDDSIRCSTAQVVVLVSAMIHNNPENETTTVIVEEADTDNKGEKEITIYKGDPDMNAEKLRFTIQSPVPTPASEESTVTIQEITDDTPESTKESMETVCTDPLSAKRDASLEIDGKYLKSVVNSRKSPRKTRNGHMRVYSSDQESHRQSYIRSDEVFQKSERSSTSKSRSPQKEPKQARSNFRWVPQAKMEFSTVSDNRTRRPRQYNMPLKGSLDSVVVEEGPRTVLERGPRREDPLKMKSKSYESIKKVPEIYHEDSARTDSTSKLITANDYDFQTDEYCSVCYLVNEMSMRTDEAGSSPNQTFYTLRSNYSSFADEDATECDICSSLNLQESVDGLDGRIPVSVEGEPICEVCEICGEVSTNYDTSQESALPTLRDSRDYVGSRGYRVRERAITDPSLDDDSFEIENCGYEPRSAQVQESAAPSEPDNKGESESTADVAALDTPVPIENLQERYFIPKDEVAILSSGTRKMARKGSLLRKITGDSVSTSQDKRRYSSVDNLQLAKPPTKNSDRSLRSKSNKLIGSADNILSSKSSRRCKSLQRSADNVRNLDSSTDNLDSFAEGSDKEDNQSQSIDWVKKLKMRDNATVKMILMKHGIKIISEKETAL